MTFVKLGKFLYTRLIMSEEGKDLGIGVMQDNIEANHVLEALVTSATEKAKQQTEGTLKTHSDGSVLFGVGSPGLPAAIEGAMKLASGFRQALSEQRKGK